MAAGLKKRRHGNGRRWTKASGKKIQLNNKTRKAQRVKMDAKTIGYKPLGYTPLMGAKNSAQDCPLCGCTNNRHMPIHMGKIKCFYCKGKFLAFAGS